MRFGDKVNANDCTTWNSTIVECKTDLILDGPRYIAYPRTGGKPTPYGAVLCCLSCLFMILWCGVGFPQLHFHSSHQPTNGLSTNPSLTPTLILNFKNLTNSFLVHVLPIPQILWQSAENFWVIVITDRQTADKTVPISRQQRRR